MTDQPIDVATFAELQATTGAKFVADLVDTFLEEGPGMLAELRHAEAARDPDRFRRAAHSLKTNASTFGATGLAALARNLELAGFNADPATSADRLAALDAQFSDAAAALRALRDG
jgi:HPt (histidine-containing phosphotransfer) domain-containing protein